MKSSCHKDVRLFGRRLFTIGGLRHRWPIDVMAIPDTTVFLRVDCTRCDYSCDGVALKHVVEEMPFMASALGVDTWRWS